MKLTLYEHLYLIVKYRLRVTFYHIPVICQVKNFYFFDSNF